MRRWTTCRVRGRTLTAPRWVLAAVLLAIAACAPEPAMRHPTIQPPDEPALAPQTLQQGVASWYGGKFAGRTTASGEIFDPKQLTAASRVLPFGAVVRVTNLHNGRQVEVRINDRGPFKRGRILDCSEEAARQLGFRARGTAQVVIDWPPVEGAPRNGHPELWVLVGVFDGPLAAREARSRALEQVDRVELHRTGRWVRVHAGPFSSRSNATLALEGLRQAGFLATLVSFDAGMAGARGD
jgi:rare lipoprotein A